jgi:hypothetical protein
MLSKYAKESIFVLLFVIAHRLAPEGKILSGRKGVTDARWRNPRKRSQVTGSFTQTEEAVEIAKGNPGLEYGQTIEVRPILPDAA